MKESAERTAQLKKEQHQTATLLLAILVFVTVGVFAFMRFYSASIDDSLYGERLNQMREVTTQLFSGLEDVVKNQWRTVQEQSRMVQQSNPETTEELNSYMKNQSVRAGILNSRTGTDQLCFKLHDE